MACFDFIISFKEALIDIISASFIKDITIQKEGVFIDTYPELTEPNINITSFVPTIDINTNLISVDTTITQLNPDIQVAMVCDINYGVPLYTPDGAVVTIDGKVVYVRRAKIEDYE